MNVTEATGSDYDVLIVGAGSAGLYGLHLLREKGLRVRVLEQGSGVGGAWYWNRYPGARLHSESHSYQFFFDPELLEEWDWSELFAGQPELERYFNRVADKHDLKKDIDLDTRVVSMTFDEGDDIWIVRTDPERSYTARVVISATGPLSAPIYPDVPGLDTFVGESFHTARWPREPVGFAGKRVIVIGTGSTGVQIIPQVAKEAAHLTVLMRTPNWVVPLNNRVLDAHDMASIRAGYPDLRKYLATTFGGFLHHPGSRPTTTYAPGELKELYETAWQGAGFTKYFGMPYDVLADETVNRHFADFVAGKIRARVDDPHVAELLIPDHPFGAKPVDCESAGYRGDGFGYYEVFNQDNVDLVRVSDNPILEIVAEGVRLADRVVEADLIVYATGFEAFVGSLNRIDIRGVGGMALRDRWADGPETYLGMAVSGFPNLFMIGGPHGKGGHGNSTRCAEVPLQWIADLAEKVARQEYRRVEPDPAAERDWTDNVIAAGNANLMSKAKSFLYSDNVPGRPRRYVAYIGALPAFVDRLRQVEADGYAGFVLTESGPESRPKSLSE
jgi:cation diffusion facilitator CzcD-associated flavoprotein CzcO